MVVIRPNSSLEFVEIRKIQREIDAYLGLQRPLVTAHEAPSSEPVDALRETPSPFGQGNEPK